MTQVGNLHNARKIWMRLSTIFRREGVNPRVSRKFFKAVVQAVLLFGLEMWVMTPRMGRAIVGFNTG